MLLRMGGGVLLVLYDEIKAHGPGSLLGTARRLLRGGSEDEESDPA
jgi:hypothetical protein